MTAMRKGQGAVLNSKELESEYLYINGRSKTRLIVSVNYEKGDAREEFVFSHTNGKIYYQAIASWDLRLQC